MAQLNQMIARNPYFLDVEGNKKYITMENTEKHLWEMLHRTIRVINFNLSFKYMTKFSLPKIACPAIVYAEIVAVIDP